MIHSPEMRSLSASSKTPHPPRALSALEFGSAHALKRGDAETARELAELQLINTPRAGVSYTLLALANASLEDWVECARTARCAFSLGSRDEELCGLLAGLYQHIKREREVDLIHEESGAYPRRSSFSRLVDASLMSALERALTEPLTLPRRASKTRRGRMRDQEVDQEGGRERRRARSRSRAEGAQLTLPKLDRVCGLSRYDHGS